ncbi:hypothetical protein [Nostoc sp.]|uniref:hypothetical protein n=1 Tax=Nostoc sp. TaxID=1180 RepID=UPI002FFBB08E
MSLIRSIENYELIAKQYSIAHLVSQFSGIVVMDYTENITSNINYNVNDYSVSFKLVQNAVQGPQVIQKTKRAWALPGYLLEGIRRAQISPGIELPTLPTGAVSTKNADVLLITTIPYYWYPQVPDGDKLVSYNLRFDAPFIDLKNNKQYFKVAQNNILDEGVVVIQLSSKPATEVKITSSPSMFDFNFT